MNESGLPELKKTLPNALYKERLLSFLKFCQSMPTNATPSTFPKVERKFRAINRKPSKGVRHVKLKIIERTPKNSQSLRPLESLPRLNQDQISSTPLVKENSYKLRQSYKSTKSEIRLNTRKPTKIHKLKPIESLPSFKTDQITLNPLLKEVNSKLRPVFKASRSEVALVAPQISQNKGPLRSGIKPSVLGRRIQVLEPMEIEEMLVGWETDNN